MEKMGVFCGKEIFHFLDFIYIVVIVIVELLLLT
jgi:hypothetical protein